MDQKDCSKDHVFYPSYRKTDCPAQKENDLRHSESEATLKIMKTLKERSECPDSINKYIQKLIKESSQDALQEIYDFQQRISKVNQNERDPDTWSAEGIPVDVLSLVLQNDNNLDVSGGSSVSALDYEMLKERDLETSKMRDCRVQQNASENISQTLCYKRDHPVGVNHPLTSISASDSVAGPSGISSKRSRSAVCGREFAENEDLPILSTSIRASDSVAGPSGISSKRPRSSVCGREFAENEDLPILSTFTCALDFVAGPSGISSKRSRNSVCGKEFADNEALQMHSLTHTVEKPFDCKSCENRYAFKKGLYRHIKSYTTKKPYVCGECRMEFALLCGLDKHLLSHSGIFYFKCDLCERCFLTFKELLTHRRSHLAEDE